MYLVLQGRVSKKIQNKLSKTIQRNFDATGTIFLFCDYSSFEVPLGKVFNYIINNSEKEVLETGMELIYITQEFLRPYDSVPIGHKTICQFKVDRKTSIYITEKFPILDTWKPFSNVFYLSTNKKRSFDQ